MRINNVQNGQNFGMAFKVNSDGAWKLAQDFVNSPKLEAKFMKKIVGPLQKADADVVYNGYSALYKHMSDDYYSSIVGVGTREYTVLPTGGPLVGSRNVYRPEDGSKLNYTNDFEEFSNTISDIKNIEAAKNIALNLSAERAGKNLDIYDADLSYNPPSLGKTINEKIESLMKLFGTK